MLDVTALIRKTKSANFTLATLALTLPLILSCSVQYQETNSSLYKDEPIVMKDIVIKTWVDLPDHKIEKTRYSKVVDKIGTLIPIIGKPIAGLLHVPFDVTFAVLPYFETDESVPLDGESGILPENGDVTDMISQMRIIDGFLLFAEADGDKPVASSDKLLENYKAYRERLLKAAEEDGDEPDTFESIEPVRKSFFMDEVKIKFASSNPKSTSEIEIAKATNKDFYSQFKILQLDTTKANFADLMKKGDSPVVKFMAAASPPKKDYFMRGKVLIAVTLRPNVDTPSVILKPADGAVTDNVAVIEKSQTKKSEDKK